MNKIIILFLSSISCFGGTIFPGGGGSSGNATNVFLAPYDTTITIRTNATGNWSAQANTNQLTLTNSVPWVRVFPDGTAYTRAGAVNTAGTKTAGISEAIHALYQTNGLGLTVGGGKVMLEPGIYDCTTNITIPNQFNFELQLEGAGKGSTIIIDSTVGTNFVVLENITGSDVASGGSKPLMYAFRNLGFAKRYDTNLSVLVYMQSKANQGLFENCAFSSLQSITFTGTGAGGIQGQAGGLLFIGGVPTNKVGTIGIRLDGGADNKVTIKKCDFYGLADGIWDGVDHSTIKDCMFSAIGKYWTNGGSGNPTYANAWTASGGTMSRAVTNILALGCAIIGYNNTYEMNIEDCYFMEANCGIANVSIAGFGPNMRIVNPRYETVAHPYVAGVDNNDDSFTFASVLDLDASAGFTLNEYLVLTNGTIRSTPPTDSESSTILYTFGPLGISIRDMRNRQLFTLDGDASVNAPNPASANVALLGGLTVGGSLLSVNQTNSGNIQTATLNVTGTTTLGTANVTSMTVTQVVNSISLFSGPTNNYDLTKSLQHYITSTAMAITGFVGSGSTPALQPNSRLVVSNSSAANITLRITSPVFADGTNWVGGWSATVTNGTERHFDFSTSTNTAGSMIAYTNVVSEPVPVVAGGGSTTTYTQTTGKLYTGMLVPNTTQGVSDAVTANTTYGVVCYVPVSFTITHTTYYIGTTDSGKHVGIGFYDISGNRLWHDEVLTTSANAVNVDSTDYTVAPGYYYFCWNSDSSSATLRARILDASDAIIFNTSTGLPFVFTAANASSSGVLPATLGVLTKDNSVTKFPSVTFD